VLALYWVGARQEYFIGDDAFISFRYARHLVDGLGLVWNEGERVEGYTNFLWVLFMAAAMKLDLDPRWVANGLGILSGAGVLMILGWLAHRRGWRNPSLWLAPLLLAVSRSFVAWSSGGLETMFFTFLVLAGLVSFVWERESRARWPVGSALLLAAASLTRPEGLFLAFIPGCIFAAEMVLRRRSLGSAVVWAGSYLAVVGTHLLWRFSYYGEWLPNTFYAKVPGAWWEQGATYLSLFASDYRVVWYLPLAVAALALRRDFMTWLFATITAAYLVYVAYVGGDRFEFRFMVPILPLLFWLVAAGLEVIVDRLTSAFDSPAPAWGAAALVSLLILALVHDGSRNEEANRMRHGINSLQMIAQYARNRAAQGMFLRRLSDRGVLPADIITCVGGAGALPYYTGWTTVDRRGLSDLRIARAPLESRGEIAHEREITYEYLRERGVVIFDILNRLVHPDLGPKRSIQSVVLDGVELPVKAVKVEGSYLIFATAVEDEEIERIFSGLEIIH